MTEDVLVLQIYALESILDTECAISSSIMHRTFTSPDVCKQTKKTCVCVCVCIHPLIKHTVILFILVSSGVYMEVSN